MTNNYSESVYELIELLKNIYNDKNFIMAIMSYTNNEDDRRKMIEYIKENKGVGDEKLTLLAIKMNKERKKT